MQMTHSRHVLNTPFRITTETIQNRPGTWNSTKISIYRDPDYDLQSNVYHEGILIGEYLRNYSSYGHETFYPFQIGEDWYALYSAEYTATRVMKLHEDRIEDWCGEESSAHGFCPVEYYIPRVVKTQQRVGTSDYDAYYADCDFSEEEFRSEIENDEFVSINYCNFGFLCGCVWGDDTSWKMRYIDLSEVPNKILSITDKFGYWELSNDLSLRKSIRMDGWEPGHDWVTLTRAEHFNLKTNERC